MPTKQRIEDYALIGDCATAALVGRNGSIDWLCLPRFDSGACFAALLGEPEHGRWLIAPLDPDARVERRYLDGSLILATRFDVSEGAVELVDFMRPHHSSPLLIRLVRGLRGRVAMRTEFVLRFDYGAVVPWVERLAEGGLSAIGGPDRVVLRTPAALHGEDLKTVGEFTIGAGETIPFALSWGPSHQPPSAAGRRRARLARYRSVLAPLVRPLRAGRPVERDGQALADRAEGADLRPDRRHRRRPDHIAARAASAAGATGIIGSAGCATPPLPSWR